MTRPTRHCAVRCSSGARARRRERGAIFFARQVHRLLLFLLPPEPCGPNRFIIMRAQCVWRVVYIYRMECVGDFVSMRCRVRVTRSYCAFVYTYWLGTLTIPLWRSSVVFLFLLGGGFLRATRRVVNAREILTDGNKCKSEDEILLLFLYVHS